MFIAELVFVPSCKCVISDDGVRQSFQACAELRMLDLPVPWTACAMLAAGKVQDCQWR